MTITRSQAESLLNQAKETKDGGGWGCNDPFSRRIYIGKAATIRFHPYLDAQDKPFRVIYRHVVYQPKPIEVLCLGDSCTICKSLKNMPAWSSKWKFQARRVGFGYATVFNLTNVNVNFAWHDSPVLLLHKSYDIALSQILKELDNAESVQKFFDPQSETPVVLARSASTPGKLSMELTGSCILRTLPYFSEGSKPLSDYLKPTEFDRGKVYEFIKVVNTDKEMEIGSTRYHMMEPARSDVKAANEPEACVATSSIAGCQETSPSEIASCGTALNDFKGNDPNDQAGTTTSVSEDEYDEYLDEFDTGEEALAEFEYWKKQSYGVTEENDLDQVKNSDLLEIDGSGLGLIKTKG